jgi:hypothetical protein
MGFKLKENIETTNNSTVYDRLRRRLKLRCSYCKPHRGDNARWKRYGSQKAKYKNIIRKSIKNI